MKRSNASLALIALLLAIVPLAGAWAVWEGNAGIASVSEFPGSGLYAKSDMFPRNTIVEIENLETGNSVRAVITGSSGISGLVAVLSPETASALNIQKGSVSRVRIRIPVPVGETPAEGLIASGSEVSSRDPDVNPAEAVRTSRTAEPAMPLSAIVESDGERMVPVDSLREPEVTEAEPVVAEAEPVVAETEPVVAETEPVVAEAEPVVAEAEPVVAEAEPVVAETEPVVAETEPVVVEPEPELVVAETEPSPTLSEETAPSEYVLSEPAPVYDDEPTLVTQEDAVASQVDLVAADPNPPVVTSESALEGPSIVVVPEVPAAKAAVEQTKLAEPATEKTPAVAQTPETVASQGPVQKLDGLPIVASLERGVHYVQIATYKDPQNVWKVLQDHAKKYPIAIERSGSDSLKVCVGPIKKDECGAVLERFKGLGFKDAFVRKGK